MKGQRIGYKRVSTLDQTTARQLEGIQVDRVFEDHCSGKDTNRPEFKRMMEHIREGDTLIVWSMDRLSRNLPDLINTVRGLVDRGVRVEFVKEGLVFTGNDSASTKLILGVFGLINQFFLDHLHEAQREGIAIAKKTGVYKGRTPSLRGEKRAEAVARVRAGEKLAAVAREYGVSRQTFYSYLELEANSQAIGEQAQTA